METEAPIEGQPSQPVMVVTEDIRTFYTNTMSIAFTEFDFSFLIGLSRPTLDGHAVNDYPARILMSPQHAKAVSDFLSRKVQLYEQTFGPIGNKLRTSLDLDDLDEQQN